MHPEFIRIGSFTVYWYGVMVALGFVAGSLVAIRRARRYELEPATISDLVVWLVIGGIIGARTGYVVAHPSEFIPQPWMVFWVRQGGLVFYGGLAGAIVATLLFARLRGVSLWRVADVMAPAVPIGHALGRIGCLLNGCCFGRVCDLPWAIGLHGQSRHPSQLYMALGNVIVAAVLLVMERRSQSGSGRRLRSGQLFWAYGFLYGLVRLVAEFFRDDYAFWLPGHISFAQVLSVVLMIVAAVAWTRIERGAPADGTN
jgi:phosphatidylglycerol:prolipoprotein diacylglycerol transferase